MKRTVTIIMMAALVASTAYAAQLNPKIPSEVTLFKNVKVFNGTEEMLHDALLRHEREKVALGSILVDLGVVSEDELERYCVAKAEETIFGLLDVEEALFEFDPESLHKLRQEP